jgi:hypothetical protein
MCANNVGKAELIVRNRSELRGGGGAIPLSIKKGTPLPFRLRSYKVKKITKNVRKRAIIAKKEKSMQKVPKINPNESFQQFLSVFLPYRSKTGSKDTVVI